MKKFSSKKKLDLAIIAGLATLDILVTIWFKADVTYSIIFFPLISSLYLFYRERKNYGKIFFASLIYGVFLGMSFAFILELDRAWVINYSFWPFNIIVVGATPLGELVWGFCIPLFILSFYEHFLDTERKNKRNNTVNFLIPLASFLLIIVLVTYTPAFFRIPYPYLFFGLVLVSPLVFLIRARPLLLKKILWVALAFAIFNVCLELAGIYAHQVVYDGQYIGGVNVFGALLPYEEILFWILLSAPSLVLCYEYFIDDRK
jgi:hypothetical protein